MTDRRQRSPLYYAARIAGLEKEVASLSIDPAYGCLTKPGLVKALRILDLTTELVVYFDIDKFKQMNSRLGKARCNQIVAECIKPRGYDLLGRTNVTIRLLGRWFSGDELAGVFPASDALGYCQRVQGALHAYNCSATFVIVPTLHRGNVFATIDYAEQITAAIKDRGYNDLICEVN
jgi:hypothetical protein